MPITHSEYCWLKLKRSFFKTPYDIYVVVAYISNGSFASKTDDILSLIENDAAKFSSDGSQILVCGDFNARTNTEPDYLTSDTNEKLDELLDLPIAIPNNDPIPRNNTDSHTADERGRNLLQLCKTTGLRIINGRFLGDTAGNFTCYSHSGAPSTIDYMLTTASLYRNIEYFQVNDLNTHSIHCYLSVSISLENFHNEEFTESNHLVLSKKFAWSQGDDFRFKNAIDSDHFQKCISNIMEKTSSGEDAPKFVDDLSSNLSKVIYEAAISASINLNRKDQL